MDSERFLGILLFIVAVLTAIGLFISPPHGTPLPLWWGIDVFTIVVTIFGGVTLVRHDHLTHA